MQSGTKLILVGVCCAAAGLGIGMSLDDWTSSSHDDRSEFSEMREGGQLLTNPLLECDSAKASIRKKALKPFEDKIERTVTQIRTSQQLKAVSVYFRELNDGLWFNVGDVENYAPVSLLKMPLMIAVLKQAERSPSFLKHQVVYNNPVDLNEAQSIKPAQSLQPGRSYTVEELVRRMIVYSDNNAFILLEGVVDPRTYQRVYSDLGIKMTFHEEPDYRITAREFATFIRILYNASYLGREMSEKGLELLTQVDFKKGIVAGVPDTIVVAHKFGEGGEHGIAELHDCGIVYYPRHPYLLCVMTRGRSTEVLEDVLGTISRVIYDAVDTQHARTH